MTPEQQAITDRDYWHFKTVAAANGYPYISVYRGKRRAHTYRTIIGLPENYNRHPHIDPELAWW